MLTRTLTKMTVKNVEIESISMKYIPCVCESILFVHFYREHILFVCIIEVYAPNEMSLLF